RRDGGAHRRHCRGAHGLRHDQGPRSGDLDRPRGAGREGGRQERPLAEGRVNAAVLTVSDGVAAGTRADESGGVLADRAAGIGFAVVERRVVRDDAQEISDALLGLTERADLILTTGGTGFSPRDVTPEATSGVIERTAPGLDEAMREVSRRAS